MAAPRATLSDLWNRLRPSAQQALRHAAELLVEGHSGTIELQCHKGGVRLLRSGREWRPSDGETQYGED